MKPQYLPGYTRVLGEEQGYDPLPIMDTTIDVVLGHMVVQQPIMVTWWQPNDEERAALLAGGAVRVSILGIAHPPIMVSVTGVENRDAKLGTVDTRKGHTG